MVFESVNKSVAYFEKRQDHFVCANYRSNTGNRSAHFIRAVVLEDLLWMYMKTVIAYGNRYERHFRAVMEQKLRLSSENAIRGHKKRLAQAEKRLTELERLFIRIYEDNVTGRITNERFFMMSKTYEDEQAQLKCEELDEIARMHCGNLSRQSTLKPRTSPAVNGGKISAFPMALWVLSH